MVFNMDFQWIFNGFSFDFQWSLNGFSSNFQLLFIGFSLDFQQIFNGFSKDFQGIFTSFSHVPRESFGILEKRGASAARERAQRASERSDLRLHSLRTLATLGPRLTIKRASRSLTKTGL